MDDIQRIIEEYEELERDRKNLKIQLGLPMEAKVGDLAWDYETKLLYICAGRLGGKAVWKRAQ